MKKLLYALLPLALCLMGSVGASAQVKTYTKTVENVELGDWQTFELFSAAEINEAAGLLNANAADLTFQLVYNGNVDVAYNGNPDEVLFWVNYAGEKHNWGDGNKGFIRYNSGTPNIDFTTLDLEYDKTFHIIVRLANSTNQYAEFQVTIKTVSEPEINIEISSNIISGGFVEYSGLDSDYTEKVITLSSETQSAIAAELGVSDLSGVTYYGYNPTSEQLVVSFAGYDGWRNTQGDFANWTGNITVPISVKINDGTNLLVYNIRGAAAGDYHAYWAYATDTKAVIVDFIVTIQSPLTTPETTISNLTIVADKEVVINAEMTNKGAYWEVAKPIELNISDAPSLLGCSADALSVYFDEARHTITYDAETGEQSASLKNAYSNAPGGVAYFYGLHDGVGLEQTSWGDYYIDNLRFDGTNLLGNIGQSPNALQPGSYYTYLYLVVGSNAYRVKVTLNVLAPSLNNMTEAGTKSITIGQVLSQQTFSTYDMTTDTPTLDDIATALGCQTGELRLYALDAEGKLSSNHTANNGGYWMDKDGRICGWATENCGLFVEPVSVSDLSTLTVGQFDNAYAEPATWTTTLYVVNTSGNNYYTLNLTVNLTMGDISLSENDTELADINGQRANVEFSRTFFEGWNTLVLPFDISMGDLLSSTRLEVVEIGTFAGDELTDETYHIHFNKLANDVTLAANTPYLIKFSGGFDGDITVSNAKINIGEPVASGTNFDFVGTYVKGELIGADDYYVGKENSFWKSNQARTTKGFRAFLKAKSEGAPARIAFDFGNGEATAIQTLDGEDVNAEQGEWYTLAGQRIAAPAHRGLYIKNGKKYFVK